jgi:hypothetical protein
MVAVGGRRRSLASLVLLLLVAAACGDSAPPRRAGGSTTAPAAAALGPTGVASDFVPLPITDPDSEGRPATRDAPEGTLRLRGCRWRGPSLMTYDAEWSSKADLDYPVRFTVILERLRDDQGLGSAGDVTLSGPGRFSVTEDDERNQKVYRGRTGDGQETTHAWEAARHDREEQLGVVCGLGTADHRGGMGPRVKPTIDLVDLPPAKAGTVEALAAALDLADPEHRLLPLPFLLHLSDRPEIDRLFVSDEGWLVHVEVTKRSTCLAVRSTVSRSGPETDGPSVDIRQSRGCPGSEVGEDIQPGTVVIPIDAAPWTVQVTGPDGDARAVARRVRPVPFAGVAPDDSAFDADAYIDGVLAEDPDLIETGRFDWRGGRVAGVFRPGMVVEGFSDPILALPTDPHLGGGGVGCRDHGVTIAQGPDGGYAFVALLGDDLVATLHRPGRPPERLAMTVGEHGWRGALVDIPAGGRFDTEDIEVTGPDGAPAACDQSG